MNLLHMLIHNKLTDSEPWRLDMLFNMIWEDVKDNLQIEQDRAKIEKYENSGISFTEFMFKNPSLLRYFK